MSELQQAADRLREAGRIWNDSLLTAAELEQNIRRASRTMNDATETMHEERLVIRLADYDILGRQVVGENNEDLELKLSCKGGDCRTLVPLVHELNNPHNWPIGRKVVVQLSENNDKQDATIVAYSNHFDKIESAYPIYVKITFRIEQ